MDIGPLKPSKRGGTDKSTFLEPFHYFYQYFGIDNNDGQIYLTKERKVHMKQSIVFIRSL